MRQPDKFLIRNGAGLVSLAAGVVTGILGSTPASAASTVHVTPPNIALSASQPSMTAAQTMIRDIRDREQRNLRPQARKPHRTRGAHPR